MKKLSVIIPVYNGENYIEHCLNQLIGYDIQIIVVDDGSKDHTKNILANFEKYPNVQIIYNAHKGVSFTRNSALQFVDTKYFAFVDCDDEAFIPAYFRLIEKMEANGQKIGCSRLNLKMAGLSFKGRKRKEGIIEFDEIGKLSSAVSVLTDKIFHRDLLLHLKQNENLQVYEDAEVSFHVLAKEGSMYFTNQSHYIYNMHANSVVTTVLQPSKVESVMQIDRFIRSLISKFKNDNLEKKYHHDLVAIAIMIYYQRIRNIYFSKNNFNKDVLASCILSLLSLIDQNYQENPIYLNGFKNNEYHDKLNVLLASWMLKKHHVLPIENMLNEEDSVKLILKKYEETVSNKI